MARFRLRFLLQEIDLPEGETLLGRSVGCHVTVEDPLVSRKHARIVVSGDRATIEDLGSRNGLVVSGRRAVGVVDVSEGARIRLGTQELVLCQTSEEAKQRRAAPVTGFMIHCGGCGFPFADEHEQCPHCGSQVRSDDTTLSGSSKQAWSLDLVAETVRRAEKLGRWPEVERVLTQANRLLVEIMGADEPVGRERLDDLAHAAAALCVERSQAEWGRWILEVYGALGWVPPRSVGEPLSTLPPEQRVTLAPAAERILRSASRSLGPSPSGPRPAEGWLPEEESPSGHHPVRVLDADQTPDAGLTESRTVPDPRDLDAVRRLADLGGGAESARGAGMAG